MTQIRLFTKNFMSFHLLKTWIHNFIVEFSVLNTTYSNLQYFLSKNNYSLNSNINIFSENVQNDNNVAKTPPNDQINDGKVFIMFM